METRKRHARKEDYRMRTHLIHGSYESKKWDYNHHVVPPITNSTAFRLSSVHRGAQGFVQFASAEEALSGHIPIYIYDRLDEPTRGHAGRKPRHGGGRGDLRDLRQRHGGH